MAAKPPADKHGINGALRARRAAMAQLAAATGKRHDSLLSSPCLGNAMSEWLLLPETLEAIHSPQNSSFINLDNGHGFNYTSDQTFVGGIYERAIKAGKRIMIY